MELRILHWNIHSWTDANGEPNINAVAALVADLSPDVVTLAEVDEIWGLPGQLREVAEKAGYSWLFVPAFEFGEEHPRGGFGNAILTRLPILAVQQWQLLWPPRLYDRTEPSEQRTVLLARLAPLGGPHIWAGITHMPREDNAARIAALARLTALTQTLDGPWLICGDFNTPASAWANSTVTSPELFTHPAAEPVEAIDYCVCSADVAADASLIDSTASDHLPQLITAQVK